jgi:acyl carrier protein
MAGPTKAEILQKLQQVFCDVFDDDSIVLSPQTKADDIPGWDSLAQVKIILGCERVFAIRLRPREINVLENVDEMTEHLEKVLSKAQA